LSELASLGVGGLFVRRRDFIKVLAGLTAASPLVVRAQPAAMPTVGYLNTGGAGEDAHLVGAFRQGLEDIGYTENRNVAIEYRWADGRYDRLSTLASNLVERNVALIFAGPLPAAVAAKAATSTIPIVFANGNDPVAYSLVASLNRPGGNVTGVSFLVNLIARKQFEVLHETVPKDVLIGFLVNPNNPNAEVDTKEVLAAAHALGRKLLILKASTPGEIDAAFSMLTQQGVGALLFHADAFFRTRNEQLAALTTRNAIPAIFHIREFPAAGGLMSYGAAATDAYRHAGRYAGRILNGERPAELPVQQATKVELVINLKTAKTLGVTLSLPLLGRADEVIE